MTLSRGFKDAVRVALAMVIVYGIVLALGWHRPYWAGLAVAMCGLSTAGESLRKGLLRIGGTLFGVVVALTLIALFPQDRWLFCLALSTYLAFCAYLMMGTSRWYFWMVAGFSVPILTLAGGPIAVNAFDTVMLRAQETVLGIGVFMLVSVFVWPSSSRRAFEQAVAELVALQQQLFHGYLAMASGSPPTEQLKKLASQAAGTQARLADLLEAAELDSFEVWEVRDAWRRLVGQLEQLTTILERWRNGFDDLDGTLPALLPSLPAFETEIAQRLQAVDDMLAGRSPRHEPAAVALEFDETALARLSHVTRAAAVLSRDQLRQLDEISREAHAVVRAVIGSSRVIATKTAEPSWTIASALEPERLRAVARQFTTLWLVLTITIFVPDVPNPAGLIALTTSASLFLCIMPQLSIASLFLPIAFNVLLSGSIYLFVMPHISDFTGLALLLFCVVFFISYTLSSPQHVITKSVSLSLFVMLINVENLQQYNFISVANWAFVFPLFFAAVALASYWPFSFKPEHVILRLLRRFLGSCARLAASPGPQGNETGFIQNYRRAFDAYTVRAVPGRIAAWSRALPRAALGDTPPERLAELVAGLQLLADRLQDLGTVRGYAQDAVLVRELEVERDRWRGGLETALQAAADSPGGTDSTALGAQLAALLERVEQRLEETLTGPAAAVPAEQCADMYRVLGAYRGVSVAVIDLARTASGIDWARLRETRF